MAPRSPNRKRVQKVRRDERVHVRARCGVSPAPFSNVLERSRRSFIEAEYRIVMFLVSMLFGVTTSSSKFSLRAYLPWPDLPVTNTGFWDPPPFRLLY